MKFAFALAALFACFATGVPAGHAQPGKPPADGGAKAAADLEFNRARAKFDAWCKQLDDAHARDASELRVTLRLADCRRLNGQLAEAKQLLAEAEQQRGAAALAEAQRAVDAEIGGPEPVSGPEVQWVEACRHFEESLRLDPSIAAQLAVAACQLRRGDLTAAREQLTSCTAALAPLAGSDEFRAVQLHLAEALTAEIDRLQPRLIVKTPAGFGGAIAIDDRAAPADAVVPVDPGAHRVRATLGNGRVEEATVEILPRAAHTVSITRGTHRSKNRQRAFWGLVGAGGVATLGAGLSFWAMESAVDTLENDRAPDQRCERISAFTLNCDPGVDAGFFKTRATLFQISAIGAGAFFAGAAVVYFTAPKHDRLLITPAVAAESVGVTAAGSF